MVIGRKFVIWCRFITKQTLKFGSMKRLVIMLCGLAALSLSAADTVLPAPETDCGTSVMKAFARRCSTREFATKDLSAQDLSNMLWATTGVNREDKRLTAPSCLNKQEIRLFVIDRNGAYEYMPLQHSLRHVADGDFRPLLAGRQEFVNGAPLCLVVVADMEKFGSSDDRSMMMAAIDAGIMTENSCIAAAGLGLAAVPRASMDADALRKVLGLSELQIPMMNIPVGYFKD